MKTAIVTGSSGNLGLAVTNKFLAEGYQVIGTVTQTDNNNTVERLESVAVDLLQEKAAADFVETVISKHKQIDAAVLTIGGFAMANIANTTTTDIEKQVQLNFNTAYNVARPVFTHMMKQGSGRIFLIGSRPGSDMHKSKGMVAYGLAKSLLFQLAELMNDEAKGTDVVTSVVVPSTIDTVQNRKAMPGADTSKWVKPEAIADVIYFYCSETAAALREPVIKVYNNA
jgi:NAD(P)-dependent dehydrogenase (short-subunit alcohol dehydrogenase family)